MTDIVNALRAEYSAIVADIRANPDIRFIKLERIAALLGTYGVSMPSPMIATGDAGDNIAGRATGPEKVPELIAPQAPRDRGPTKRHRVRAEVTALMQECGRVHRNAILDRLVERGVMGHEKDPMSSLAAYLSEMRDTFDYDGKGNWWLKSPAPPSNGTHCHEGELPLAASGAE